VVSVSAVPPPTGIEELLAALEEHRATLDVPATRLRARRAGALADFAAEHGEQGIRRLGGRRGAEALLESQPPGLEVPALVEILQSSATA
jgi:LAO/AO transport system kinase